MLTNIQLEAQRRLEEIEKSRNFWSLMTKVNSTAADFFAPGWGRVVKVAAGGVYHLLLKNSRYEMKLLAVLRGESQELPPEPDPGSDAGAS